MWKKIRKRLSTELGLEFVCQRFQRSETHLRMPTKRVAKLKDRQHNNPNLSSLKKCLLGESHDKKLSVISTVSQFINYYQIVDIKENKVHHTLLAYICHKNTCSKDYTYNDFNIWIIPLKGSINH